MSRNEKNKKWFIVMAAVIVCFAFSPTQTVADTWGKLVFSVATENKKLLASDGAASDYFGQSVSISGNRAIVGAYGDDDYSGSAYIFEWNGVTWSQQQKLTASDGAASDEFGYSVSIGGDYAIVGARGDDNKGTDSGSVYIFKWNGSNWVQQARLTASDGAASDQFGYSVSIGGDYAIVGAYGDDGKGSAYIFKRDGTSWSQQQKVTASDGAGGEFGVSVSISGDYAIVGAYRDDDKGPDSGSAYIFEWKGTNWIQQQKLTASDGVAFDWFGISVSISGDYAIVGALYHDSYKGSAYIFKWNGTSWLQRQKLTASDGVAYDLFGISVSIRGDYAIVGAWGYADDVRKGSAYTFKWNGTSWVQLQKLTASDGVAYDWFGISVSISGDYAIVGAYEDDDKGTESGSAYAFRFRPGADLNNDYKVDFADFAISADWWLYGTD